MLGSVVKASVEKVGPIVLKVPVKLDSANVSVFNGKGELHGEDMAAFVRSGAVYFAAIGGLGALLAKQISSAHVVGYEDLGPEALYSLEIAAFPAVVVIDRAGRNFHETARAQWRKR